MLLINFVTKINIMNSVYIAKLDLKMQKTNIIIQKVTFFF